MREAGAGKGAGADKGADIAIQGRGLDLGGAASNRRAPAEAKKGLLAPFTAGAGGLHGERRGG